MELPIPTELSRQVGVAESGSPLSLSRSSSEASSSPRLGPDISIKVQLYTYKVYLEHEVEWTTKEIHALHEEVVGGFPRLRDRLQKRLDLVTLRLSRVNSLLEVL